MDDEASAPVLEKSCLTKQDTCPAELGRGTTHSLSKVRGTLPPTWVGWLVVHSPIKTTQCGFAVEVVRTQLRTHKVQINSKTYVPKVAIRSL